MAPMVPGDSGVNFKYEKSREEAPAAPSASKMPATK